MNNATSNKSLCSPYSACLSYKKKKAHSYVLRHFTWITISSVCSVLCMVSVGVARECEEWEALVMITLNMGV